MNLSRGIADVLATGGDKPAIEFQDRWYSWAELRRYADAIAGILKQAGVPDDRPVALITRNRIAHAAAILGFVGANRTVSMVYSMQSPDAIARDIRDLRAVAVVADQEDWTPAVIAAAASAGSVGIALSMSPDQPVSSVPGLERLGPGPHRPALPDCGLELLTSGTTGAPKRVQIPVAGLARGIVTTTLGEATQGESPPFILCLPIGNIAVVMLIAQAYMRQRVVLMEKFNLAALLQAVKKHRVQTLVAVFPVIRQLIDAGVPKADLASLKFVFGGAGQLDPEVQEEFEAKYGIPILWGYGATEFAGTAATWTPELREQFGARKRGSVGKAVAGVNLRTVDPETGEVQAHGVEGYLEAQVAILGEGWIRTTDMAYLDEDGFLYIRARGDGAINRGGFKIIPERVVEVLRRHPAVRDAAVIGLKDPVLGQVPAALVEIRPGASAPTVDELEALVRQNLPSHHVPARFRLVHDMPRTPSLKISLDEARKLLENESGPTG